MKRSEKQLPSKANFSTFLQLNYSNFRLKPYEKPKLSKKLNLKGSGASWKPKNVSRDNHSHHKVFETNSCEIEPYEKSLISVFQESFANTFHFGRGTGRWAIILWGLEAFLIVP